MSTAVIPSTLDLTQTPRVPFGRLVRVELRKVFDTRAGLWLGLITVVASVLTMGGVLLAVALSDDMTLVAGDWMAIMSTPVSLLLPALAIVAVTSEWGQRSHLVTFTLEPHRSRVIAAKLVTVLLLGAATIAVTIVTGTLGNLLYGAISGNEVVWDLELSVFGWALTQQVLFFLMAFAVGALLLSTPGAISVYYVVALLLPFMVYMPLVASFGWAADTIPWVDLSHATTPFLMEGEIGFDGQIVSISGEDYAHVAVATLLWVVLPLVFGLRRVLRAEVK